MKWKHNKRKSLEITRVVGVGRGGGTIETEKNGTEMFSARNDRFKIAYKK